MALHTITLSDHALWMIGTLVSSEWSRKQEKALTKDFYANAGALVYDGDRSTSYEDEMIDDLIFDAEYEVLQTINAALAGVPYVHTHGTTRQQG